MPRIERPLKFRTLQTTGEVLLRAELELAIKTNRGTWEEMTFLVDSGTEMTTVPAARAKKQDLPIPRTPVSGLTFHGQEVRAGLLRVRVVSLGATELIFPCYFLGDPNGIAPQEARNLLGLTGVIHQLRLGFDGTPTIHAPYGRLVVETP
ncbi:MAG: aspartyl protease family protein [Isosphaerales bacterium]